MGFLFVLGWLLFIGGVIILLVGEDETFTGVLGMIAIVFGIILVVAVGAHDSETRVSTADYNIKSEIHTVYDKHGLLKQDTVYIYKAKK